ncbi:MAG: hypothetical protein ABT940_09910, partial [Alphaproteobacteria bacterium]
LNLLVFYLVNGYLLGRTYYEVVALRRLDVKAAAELRRSGWMTLLPGGVVVAFLMTVPVVNIVAPVVATAFMVHHFEKMRRRLP